MAWRRILLDQAFEQNERVEQSMSEQRKETMALGINLLQTDKIDASATRLLDLAKGGDPLAAHYIGRWLCKGGSAKDRADGIGYLVDAASSGHLPSLIFAQAELDKQGCQIDLFSRWDPTERLAKTGIKCRNPSALRNGINWKHDLMTPLAKMVFLRAAAANGATPAVPRLAFQYIGSAYDEQALSPLSPTARLTLNPLQKFLMPLELASSLAFELLQKFYRMRPLSPDDELLENNAIANGFQGYADLAARIHVKSLRERRLGTFFFATSEMFVVAPASVSEELIKQAKEQSYPEPWLVCKFRVPRSHEDIMHAVMSAGLECGPLLDEPDRSLFQDHVIGTTLLLLLRAPGYDACYAMAAAWRALLTDASRVELLKSRYRRLLKDKKSGVGYFVSKDQSNDIGRVSASSKSRVVSFSLCGPLCIWSETESSSLESFGSAAIFGSPFKIAGTNSFSLRTNMDFGFWQFDDAQALQWTWQLRSYEDGSTERTSTRSGGRMNVVEFEGHVSRDPTGWGMLSDMLEKAWAEAKCDGGGRGLSDFERTLSDMQFINAIDFDRRGR